MRIAGRAAFCAVMILAAAVPAAAGHHARTAKKPPAPLPPKRNFVALDLTPSVPKPMATIWGSRVRLIDSASVRRDGDSVTFDLLEIGENFQETSGPNAPPAYNIWNPTRLEHFRGTCGWRTIKMEHYEESGDATNMDNWSWSNTFFVDARSPYRTVLDRVCAGQPLNAAAGVTTVEAAVAMWRGMFPDPAHQAVPVMFPQAPPSQPTWTGGPNGHRFTAVASDAATGDALFLDIATLLRDGDNLTGVDFELLGPGARDLHATAFAVGRERQMHYDCRARTATVLAQASWNAQVKFIAAFDGTDGPHGASESPVIAAEIAAACDGIPASAPSFPSLEAAWQSGPATPSSP